MPRLLMWMAARVHHMVFIVIHMAAGGIHMVSGEVHMAAGEVHMAPWGIHMVSGEVWMPKKTIRWVFFALRCVYFALGPSYGTEMIFWRVVLVALLKENPWWGVAGGTIFLMWGSDSPAAVAAHLAHHPPGWGHPVPPSSVGPRFPLRRALRSRRTPSNGALPRNAPVRNVKFLYLFSLARGRVGSFFRRLRASHQVNPS